MLEGRTEEALNAVDDAMDDIGSFFVEYGHPELASSGTEITALVDFKQELTREAGMRPLDRLKNRLNEAVAREEYEAAARIRDKIRNLEKNYQA